GELEAAELDAFLERLKTEPELAEELEMHRLLVEGIKEHRKEELKAYLQEKGRVRFMGNPWSKTWTWASAAILVAFGIIYFTIPQNENNEALSEKEPTQQTEEIGNAKPDEEIQTDSQEKVPGILPDVIEGNQLAEKPEAGSFDFDTTTGAGTLKLEHNMTLATNEPDIVSEWVE